MAQLRVKVLYKVVLSNCNVVNKDYPATAQARFNLLSAQLKKRTHRPFGMFPVCLKIEGCIDLHQKYKILSKFDITYVRSFVFLPNRVRNSDGDYAVPFHAPLAEDKFVVYGPRGIRRILWEYTKDMFQGALKQEWEDILC